MTSPDPTPRSLACRSLARRASAVLATAALPLLAAAQDTLAADLPDGRLRAPEDEGLPWFYIVLVAVLLGLFFLLRRGRKPLPSKRGPRP